MVQAGHNRGRFGDEAVFTISRSYDKIEFTRQNTAFYFDPQHPLARASKANISNAVLASESIVSQDDDGYLVSAGSLFLKESMLQVKPSGGDSGKSVLGKLSDTKTKFTELRSYPDNTQAHGRGICLRILPRAGCARRRRSPTRSPIRAT